MSAKQTTTTKVTVTRVKIPKSVAKSNKNNLKSKRGQNKCSKCGRFV